VRCDGYGPFGRVAQEGADIADQVGCCDAFHAAVLVGLFESFKLLSNDGRCRRRYRRYFLNA
jgi:hypothetical protein